MHVMRVQLAALAPLYENTSPGTATIPPLTPLVSQLSTELHLSPFTGKPKNCVWEFLPLLPKH